MDMESEEKVELIQPAVQKLREERREKKLISSSEESKFVGDDHDLVSGFLSQLETLDEEGKLQQPEPRVGLKKAKSDTTNEAESGSGNNVGREEIIRELKKVQKQNFITHCLLSVTIALTVAFQLSEVTLIFKLKNGLSHPFKSIGSMLTGILKGHVENAQTAEKESVLKHQHNEVPSTSPLQIPGMPHLDFTLGLDGDKH